MQDFEFGPDLSVLERLLPEGCGVLLYTRSGASPWEIRTALGDGPGVLGVPTQTLREVWSELVHPEDEESLLSSLAVLGAGESISVDYRVRTSLGGERWVRDTVRRAPTRGGRGIIVGVLRDLTAERSLGAQAAALEERIYRAQRVDSLGGLAAGIAHDLGNLLTAILSAAHSLEQAEGLPSEFGEDLAVVRESARRGSRFVRQILRFAAHEEPVAGLVDLNTVVGDLTSILSRSLGEDVRLVVRPEDDLPQIEGDPGQIEQVLLNLAVNGREAMPDGGTLTIVTERVDLRAHTPCEGGTLSPGPYVVLSVSDTGTGIPADVRPRIFEPLFSTKRKVGSGSGFGLSTVQRILLASKGGIRLDTREGKGTTFRVYLPVKPAVADTIELPEVAEPPVDVARRGRILVVESDLAVRDVMNRVLTRERFSVMAVGTARDALRTFDRVRPQFDLLVTDLALADTPGLELGRLLRNRVANLPIVCMTSGVEDRLPSSASELPGAVELDKPFLPSQLVQSIERALAWSAEQAGREGSGGV